MNLIIVGVCIVGILNIEAAPTGNASPSGTNLNHQPNPSGNVHSGNPHTYQYNNQPQQTGGNNGGNNNYPDDYDPIAAIMSGRFPQNQKTCLFGYLMLIISEIIRPHPPCNYSPLPPPETTTTPLLPPTEECDEEEEEEPPCEEDEEEEEEKEEPPCEEEEEDPTMGVAPTGAEMNENAGEPETIDPENNGPPEEENPSDDPTEMEVSPTGAEENPENIDDPENGDPENDGPLEEENPSDDPVDMDVSPTGAEENPENTDGPENVDPENNEGDEPENNPVDMDVSPTGAEENPDETLSKNSDPEAMPNPESLTKENCPYHNVEVKPEEGGQVVPCFCSSAYSPANKHVPVFLQSDTESVTMPEYLATLFEPVQTATPANQ